jgi:general stress protein 26
MSIFLYKFNSGGIMTQEIKDNINKYLANHYYLNLATVNSQNNPIAHTMAYVSKDSVVYLSTNKYTRKVQNINENPHVAYTVDEDNPDLFAMKALQVEGKASIITDINELREVGEIMAAKFPFVADMPVDPDAIMIKIEPDVIYYSDYSVGFGHRDKIDF